MTTGRKVALGCGIAAVVALVGAAGVGGCIAYVSQDPVGMSARVIAPHSVTNGETFELRVEVANHRSGKSMTISSIDVADEYLAGFKVMETVPPHRSVEHIPIDNSRSYTFEQKILAGQTNVFTFMLVARKAGDFAGEVDICEGMRLLTQIAETSVD